MNNKLSGKASFILTALLLLAAPVATRTKDFNQDLNFRLLNIERRLDQMQIRVDSLERAQQIQAPNTTGAQHFNELLLEMQRQQLLVAQQQIALQQELLKQQKIIDQLTARLDEREKGEKAKEAPAPQAKPAEAGKTKKRP